MWDCYSFQAYLRQIGKYNMWLERIYPGMRKAIVGTMLASQENMDRRINTFELFGADFMICENFYPWLIEINSSPDLGATTSVTARMCPKCLEDVVKVVVDRRLDPKSDLGNFELVYRQVVPPTPAYMGLNLFVKGKQLLHKVNHGHSHSTSLYQQQRKERSLATSSVFRQRSAIVPAATVSRIHRAMPTFNATEYIEKYMIEPLSSSRSSINSTQHHPDAIKTTLANSASTTASTYPCILKQAGQSITQLLSDTHKKRRDFGALPHKRQRSCGPRFSANQVVSNEAKFKILIKNYGASNGADNLLEKSDPPSASVLRDRKWRSLRNVTNTSTSISKTKPAQTARLMDSSGICSFRFARSKSEIEYSSNIHAVGRTFGRKSNGLRLPISVSVQALHRGEPILAAIKQVSEAKLSQPQIAISPIAGQQTDHLNGNNTSCKTPTC
ncbi:tubulin glycylase 3A [Drosophila sulfurigaster albostrigata]|uniref:tubulin glycylase 3A n=1 Tax=Drosophila sulfurigaster albostrigata TaxID=89887 RepID=UPI002D21842F|nr:tubulin glycylase 3A [Drosophila sulfurigaster albostrigata]